MAPRRKGTSFLIHLGCVRQGGDQEGRTGQASARWNDIARFRDAQAKHRVIYSLSTGTVGDGTAADNEYADCAAQAIEPRVAGASVLASHCDAWPWLARTLAPSTLDLERRWASFNNSEAEFRADPQRRALLPWPRKKRGFLDRPHGSRPARMRKQGSCWVFRPNKPEYSFCDRVVLDR